MKSIEKPPGPAEMVIACHGAADPTEMVLRFIESYGNVVRYHTLYGQFTLVNQPALVRDVLCDQNFARNKLLQSVLGQSVLSSEGAQWKQQRRQMLPAFQRKMIEPMVDLFVQVTLDATESWSLAARQPQPVDVTRAMNRIALSSVGLALFATPFDDPFLDAFDVVMKRLGAILNAATFGASLVLQPEANRRFDEAMNTIQQSAVELMTATADSPLLNILHSGHDCHAKPLSSDQIRDEVLTMLTAGHETTAVTLGWALHCLTQHPRVAERFHAEVDSVLGDRLLTAADIPNLIYTRMIVDEVLRLYPPVWLVARTATDSCQLGGYPIPAGNGVLVSPFALQRHHDHWPDPLQFNPDRFAPGQPEPVPYSYIPFLASRHICLGKHFALAELVSILATLGQRFHFSSMDGESVQFEPLLSLRVKDGLKLRVQSRINR